MSPVRDLSWLSPHVPELVEAISGTCHMSRRERTHVVCQALKFGLGKNYAVTVFRFPLKRRPDEMARHACRRLAG